MLHAVHKSIALSNMGKRALTSHARIKGCKRAMINTHVILRVFLNVETNQIKAMSIKQAVVTFVKLNVSMPSREPQFSDAVEGEQLFITSIVTNGNVMKAEILWAIKSAMSYPKASHILPEGIP